MQTQFILSRQFERIRATVSKLELPSLASVQTRAPIDTLPSWSGFNSHYSSKGSMSSGKLPSALNITPSLNQQPRGILNDSISKKPDSLSLPPTPGSAGSQGYHNNHYAYGNDNTAYMNSQGNTAYGAIEYGHHHHSQGQPPTPQTATSNYPSQPPILQPNYQSNNGFPQFPFNNGVPSPAGQPGVSGPMGVHHTQQLLPLPQNTSMTPNHPSLGPVSNGGPQSQSSVPGGYSNHSFDTTGQIAPPGMKPRVAATLWEDEGSLCFQVEARGVCVARREGTLPQFKTRRSLLIHIVLLHRQSHD